MFALPIFMLRFESINFYQNIPKIKLFLQKKMQLNAKKCKCKKKEPPDPRASSDWGLCPQTPSLRRLETSPSGLQSIPPTYFFLRAWCFYCGYVILCKLILRLAGVYSFPQAALSLDKFAYP